MHGVRSTGLEKYKNLHTRICRPIGLTQEECLKVSQSAISQIGHKYDLRNVFDLARYLFPTPPVPTRFRRQLLALGSGDPTRAICSTLIAQAFESIHYPIIALEPKTSSASANDDAFLPQKFQPQQFKPKHHSLLTPAGRALVAVGTVRISQHPVWPESGRDKGITCRSGRLYQPGYIAMTLSTLA